MYWWRYLIIFLSAVGLAYLIQELENHKIEHNTKRQNVKTLNELLPPPCEIYPELTQCEK